MHTERSSKQCRERWCYILKPGLKKMEWTKEEDITILNMQKTIGNQWATISRHLDGRTDIDVKNRFSSLQRTRRNKPRKSKLLQTQDSAVKNVKATKNTCEHVDTKVKKLSTVESLNMIQKELQLYPIPQNSMLTIPFCNQLSSSLIMPHRDELSSFSMIPNSVHGSLTNSIHNNDYLKCAQSNFNTSRNDYERIHSENWYGEKLRYISICTVFFLL